MWVVVLRGVQQILESICNTRVIKHIASISKYLKWVNETLGTVKSS